MACRTFQYLYVLLVGTIALKVQRTSDSASLPAMPLNIAANVKSVGELVMSQGAMQVASVMSQSAEVTRQEYLALTSKEEAEEAWDKVRDKVPEARGQYMQVRQYATVANMYLSHINQIAAHFKDIPAAAAHEAKVAVAEWIAEDAAAVAVNASKQNFTMEKQDKIANAVGAAAEPYHLAILRNQKFCAETYEKAKGAQTAAQKLATEAKTLALKAQQLQSSGMGADAQQSMLVADGMMTRAEDLRQWGLKLYGDANSACAGIAEYGREEVQAAANSAATFVMNEPMKLPYFNASAMGS